MSDLGPLCAPKQTPPTTMDLWVHAQGHRRRAYEVICPTGANHPALRRAPVYPRSQKYFVWPFARRSITDSSRPASERGALAIVTNVGCGMQWTRAAAQDERRQSGRRSRVVLTPR